MQDYTKQPARNQKGIQHMHTPASVQKRSNLHQWKQKNKPARGGDRTKQQQQQNNNCCKHTTATAQNLLCSKQKQTEQCAHRAANPQQQPKH